LALEGINRGEWKRGHLLKRGMVYREVKSLEGEGDLLFFLRRKKGRVNYLLKGGGGGEKPVKMRKGKKGMGRCLFYVGRGEGK